MHAEFESRPHVRPAARAGSRTGAGAFVHPTAAGFACALVLILAIGLVVASPAIAVDEPSGWSYDLARDVMSPFCPGRTLAACPSPQAAELIEWVVLQERAGASRAEVEEQLYQRYGDIMRSAPKPEGWGLVAYVFPVLAALAGVALVVFVLRRIAGGAPAPAAPPVSTTAQAAHPGPVATGDADAELQRIVDDELSRI